MNHGKRIDQRAVRRLRALSVPKILRVRRWQRDTCGLRYGDLFDGESAGTDVRGMHPLAVIMMMDIGTDMSGHRSWLIDEFFDQGSDIVVTVCDSDHRACPFFPGVKIIIHAGFPDPSSCSGSPHGCLAQFRQVR